MSNPASKILYEYEHEITRMRFALCAECRHNYRNHHFTLSAVALRYGIISQQPYCLKCFTRNGVLSVNKHLDL
jgi:hypothetical protein